LAKERHIQMKDLMDVLWFIVVLTQCCHITLEEYFEEPNAPKTQQPCHTKCSFCLSEHTDATTTFRCAFLVAFLSTKVFLLGLVPVAKLIKCLGNNKSTKFTTPGYKLNQGIVDNLCFVANNKE
jgi:hypothetical protein